MSTPMPTPAGPGVQPPRDTPAAAAAASPPAAGAGPAVPSSPRRSWLLIVASLLALVAFAGGVRIAARMIASHNPQEYRESAELLSTALLVAGKNPYALDVQPAFTNPYGILYHLAVWPLAKLSDDTFAVHRAVAAFFTLAAVAALAWGLRLAGVRGHLVWVGAALFFTDLATRFEPVDLMARPDSLGLTLYLLAVLTAWRWRSSWASLGACLVLSLLAWSAKPYFILGLPVVAAHVLLFRDRTKGLIFAAAGAAAAFGLALWVNDLLPCYLNNTFYAHRGLANDLSWEHLWFQLRTYAKSSPGTVALVIAGLVTAAVRWRAWAGRAVSDWRSDGWRAPLLPAAVDLPTFALICSLVVFVASMGRHRGNTMLYVYHLISPWAILAAMRTADPWTRRAGSPRAVAAALAIVLDLALAVAQLRNPPPDQPEVWDQWRALIAACDDVYAPGPLAVMQYQLGKPVWDDGCSEAFEAGVLLEPPTMARVINRQYARHVRAANRACVEGAFDLVIIPYTGDHRWFTFVNPADLPKHYAFAGTATAPMMFQGPWTMQVWRRTGPRPTTAPAGH